MLFTELKISKALLNALEDLNYVQATPIQYQSYSRVLSGRDFIGIAPTGTGKTIAYGLPILKMLDYSQQVEPRVLVVVPTRELVIQSVKELDSLSKYMNIKVLGVYGGTNIRTQMKAVHEKHDILIATPGRLADLALNGALKLKGIRKLVLDEFDEMLNLGFRPQIVNILDMLPDKRQNLLFSATMSEDIESIVHVFFNNPQKIQIVPHGTPVELVIQKAYDLKNHNTKLNFLIRLLKDRDEYEKVLVFTKSKRIADLVSEFLKEKMGDIIDVIHSNKSQNYRIKAVERFEQKSIRILVATEVIARGIDISNISHVINFDIPDKAINYIHRIGRTGRADKRGIAISFIADYEMDYVLEIEELMNKEIPRHPIPEDLEVIDQLIPEEIPKLGGDKNYKRTNQLKDSKGAFHDKKLKNQKTNLGSPFRQKKKKYKKPIKRSGQKR